MEVFKRFAKWIRGRDPGFTLIKGPEGRNMLVDDATLEYLQSTAPEPTQVALDSLMEQVHTVRVRKGGCRGDTLLGSGEVLLDVRQQTDLAALRLAMKIDGPSGHCMCFGGPTLEMLSGDQSRLALIGIHHGESLRWHRWKSDAALHDGRLLVDWLAQRGVDGPMHELEWRHAYEKQLVEDWHRWLAAMPSALRPVWPDSRGEAARVNLAPLRATLVWCVKNK
jgi:hypothetical protein